MKKRAALFNSVIALILCVAMLAGSTFAWFTDSVTNSGNIIKSGKLDLEVYWAEDLSSGWNDVENVGTNKIFDYKYWEPGYTQVRYIKIVNAGDLAFRYALEIKPNGEVSKLADVIDVYAAETIDGRADLTNPVGTLREAITGDITAKGELIEGEVILAIALKMREEAGNEYQNLSIGDSFGITVNATQYTYEEDSFGDDYDTDADFPGLKENASGSADVKTENGVTTAETTITTDTDVKATVPAGVKVTGDKITLTVTAKDGTDGNITAGEGEDMAALDVHIEGVDPTNTTPIIVELGAVLPKGLNMGNMSIYHVENGVSNAMTHVTTPVNHNEFSYDPATGNVTVAMATFSEITVVAEQPKWEGNRDYSWYDASKTEMLIANADQLAAFGAIVGGMDGQTQDSFKDKTVKLICDITIGEMDGDNGLVFYPIGYYNSDGTYERTGTAITSGFRKFEGTFDGNGHTVSDFYHNTWEMKGDNNEYDLTLQYYRDGMGLFGKVYGGTVKNLTVRNFQSDGEYTTTGVIAAYADCGATFENIAIFNCNPRVYNIGNGGIVGCVGWYANEAHTNPVTFRNITVDNTNKISALWGSWDVACGGLVGQFYPTSGQENAIDNAGIYMENCHVAAQIDVYNDVCANYQYYAYRYAGILVGSVRENETIDGHVYPKMDKLSAKNCTVHFGDWNDYYYCELVANSLASYTHDHQMSRLEQVAKVEGNVVTYLNGKTETITGTRNFVVVKAKDDKGMWIHGDGHDYAECYHFVNGNVWNHADAGTETVDGQTVLKEDKQLIYREFNNLVTGYGWGVTSKGVGEMDGVTILDREEGNSVVKFVGKGVPEIESSTAIRIGDLFSFVDHGVELVPSALIVSITDLDHSDGFATATFTPNATNWEDGTLTVSGKGHIAITIQDYYFCAPTTIELYCIDPIQSLTVYATTLYAAGQQFNINRAVVNYKYGANKELTADQLTVGAYDFSVAGLKTVTVSYTEYGHTVSQSLNVEVVDAFNGLIAAPKKTTYEVGTELTVDDFLVTCVDSNGKPHEISGYRISAIDTSTTGKKTVIVSVTNPSTGNVASTTCEVLIFKLENISDQVEQYWFFDGNFNVSGWSHIVNPGAGYLTYVGQTYTAPNGETVTGFDGSWADPATTPNNGATGTGQTAHMSAGRYDLVINDAVPYTTLGINCIAGYSEPLLGFGYYVDGNLSTLQYSAPGAVYDETNCGAPDVNNFTLLDYLGPNNGHAVVEMNCNNFAPGSTHTVYWVAVFADGVKNISEWKVHMKVAEQSDEVFVDTEKPNVNVIIMAGQSNMFGASPITQDVRNKYENFNFSNVYIHYNNINFNVNADGTVASTMQTYFSNDGFQKYQLGIGAQGNAYFGPETNLAYYLATSDQFKNDQWYIIKYAAAGTGLAAHWMSACTVNGQTTTLTDDMLSYIQEDIAALESEGFDVQIHSFMWMQGESDAIDKTWAESYAANEKALVSRVRNAFAGNAARYAGDPTVPGGGMAFINAGIAINDADRTTANGGPNDWIWDEIVNAGKISNSQQLCSVPGYNAAMNGMALQTGPLAGITFIANGIAVPTIVNPNLDDAIVNSIYCDTQHLLSKLDSTNEHAEYTGNDSTDWAHYGASSMITLGELFASSHHYMSITGPIESGKYTVTYDANGGSCAAGSASIKKGGYVNLPEATREGYTFLGWYDAATGGNKIGNANEAYTPTANVTLYAQWESTAPDVYTVAYDANGGTVSPASQSVNAGESVTLPTPTLEGYTCTGWYTAATGGTKVGNAGASYTPSSNITLYAQWEQISYTITISKQDNATVTVNTTTAHCGDIITVTVRFTKDSNKSLVVKDANTTILNKDADGTYTFEMPANNVTIEASSEDGCITPDTLITLADGTQVRVDSLKGDELLLVWDFFAGEYAAVPAALIVNHGYGNQTVIKLTFEDGTVVKAISAHAYFDADTNRWEKITAGNAHEYIGHKFVQVAGNGYSSVKLVDVEVYQEYTESYSLVSAYHYNFITENMFSLTNSVYAMLAGLEVGEDMTYNQETLAKDVEQYGLYTYADFADYITYEQYVAFNGDYLKISVEKGYITFEGILNLIETYLR